MLPDKEETSGIQNDIGVFASTRQVYLYHTFLNDRTYTIRTAISADGFIFKKFKKDPEFIDKNNQPFPIQKLDNIRISGGGDNEFLLTGQCRIHLKCIVTFVSEDGIKWKEVSHVNFPETITVLPNSNNAKGYIAFSGNSSIFVSYSDDLQHWSHPNIILSPRHSYFDNFSLQVGNAIYTQSGILLTYYVVIHRREGKHFVVGVALIDNNNPTKVIWRASQPIWEQPNEWDSKKIIPLGTVVAKGKLIFYFSEIGKTIYAISHPSFDELLKVNSILNTPRLVKVSHNPIITPILQHYWESQATFNPAAVETGDTVHFLYRAIGDDNTSVFGYAASADGININERSSEPAYIPRESFELPNGKPWKKYLSGGGYGGCEDPRLTKIGNTIYLTYVAFDGWNPPRVALSSINVSNFENKRWDKWTKPKLISKPNVVDKNAAIFPEKINGKYVIMHRIFPNILVDFVDDLSFSKSYLKGEYVIAPRAHSWDSRKIGAGAPPIRTDKGWLLVYHAVDDRNDSQYKIGAMLLDLENPLKILYWSREPIIIPDMWYDNVGYKSGVVYPCGAVVKNNELIVYYGGADTVVCAAKQPLDIFLDLLIKSSKVWTKEIIMPNQITLPL